MHLFIYIISKSVKVLLFKTSKVIFPTVVVNEDIVSALIK